MMEKREVIGLIFTIALFAIACVIGKAVMDDSGGSSIGFNHPVFGIMILGEIGWLIVSRRIWREKKQRESLY